MRASDLMLKYANVAGPSKAARAGSVTRTPNSDLAAQEAQVLAQERALKAATGGKTSVNYKYEMGPDGQRYIVGAEVTMSGSEDEIDRVGGGVKRETLKPSFGTQGGKDAEPKPGETDQSEKAASPTTDSEESPEVQAQIKELQSIEQSVVAHEAAHMAAGGQFAGGVSYSYTKGPDGRNYITGGEVPISMPASDDPRETIQNAAQVMRAALAPADPSGADLGVAAAAAQAQAQARADLARESAEGSDEPGETEGSLWDLAAGFGDKDRVADKGRDAKNAKDTKDAAGAERARSVSSPVELYAGAISPRGLWSASRGYEAHDVGSVADERPTEGKSGSLLNIAA